VNVDKAVRYHRLKRQAAIGATVVTTGVLLALLLTPASAALRDLAASVSGVPATGASSPATIAIYVLLVCALLQAAGLPVTYYSGVVLERRYGLSTERIGHWVGGQIKAMLVGTIVALAGSQFLYFTIRQWPAGWWVAAAVGCGGFMLLVALAAPVVLLPLFYRFKPLDRPELHGRLRSLSERAGVPVLGVYEWGLGAQTHRANAALVGMGTTRRILLSDTLLAGYSDDEIEVILAHELAHHAHRDVLTAVAVQTVLLLVAFFASVRAFDAIASGSMPIAVIAIADVAGFPLFLLVLGSVSWAMAPMTNALSRLHERRADAYALRLTERPAAFISAMRRLGAQNLAEPQPSRIALWLFHSHPPIEERIERARRFAS
jgi:STE24 endopeptidase